ncbi:MAG TPA: DUF3823 domain-containing protein [Bacteroidales bacterium]|nr:DUF3823 domain-containing protein [Bacteroidales bacterium]
MKKIYYLIFIIGALLFTVTSCEIDNYPEPDAQVYGAIRDSVGGGLVETDINSTTGSLIGVRELGRYADNPTRKTWLIKPNGEYRNNLVYANDYQFDFTSCNFFSRTEYKTVNPGPNNIDFTVVPYIRIKNLSITYDDVAKKVNATFSLEGGKPNVQVTTLKLYAWSDMYVGENVKKSLNTGTGTPTRNLTGAARVINPATTYTLSIDVAANMGTTKDGFGVHRNYYFRVGALATGPSGQGTIKYNYAPYVVIPL